MSLEVVLEADAINRAAGFLADDPDGLRRVLEAIDDLRRYRLTITELSRSDQPIAPV